MYLAKTMLQRGSVLVSTDISAEMIKLSKVKFDDPNSDYSSVPGNKYISKPEGLGDLGTHNWDLEVFIEEELQFKGTDRAVIAAAANNESLPFKDETFDCYLASLSLMLVDNYLNMLKEAYRVCKPGSPLAFTIWGRKENN